MRLLIQQILMLQFITPALFAMPNPDGAAVMYDSTYVIQINPKLPRIAVQLRQVAPTDRETIFYDLVAYRILPSGIYNDTIQIIADSERVDEPSTVGYGLEFQDMNFDGYLDILCPYSIGNHGDINYSVWLFNPERYRFEYNEDLSDIGCNPTVDESSHCITVSSITCAFGCFSVDTYHVENNRPTLVAQAQRGSAEQVPGKEDQLLFHEIRRELIDGVWLVTFDKIGTLDELSQIH